MTDLIDYYRFGDFLGVTLEIANGRIKGKGQLKTEWGLTSVRLVAEVFSGKLYKDDSCAVLIACPKDLGIGVCFIPAEDNAIDLFVLDRSKLLDRGARFLDDTYSVVDAWLLFEKKAVVHFKGKIGDRFEKV